MSSVSVRIEKHGAMSDIAARGQTSGRHRGFRLVSLLWLLFGLACSIAVGSLAAYNSLLSITQTDYRAVLGFTCISYIVAAAIVRYVRRFALVNLWAIVIWNGAGMGLLALFVLTLAKQPFSLVYVVLFYAFTVAALAVWVLMIHKIQLLRLALVPGGLSCEVLRASHPQLILQVLAEPEQICDLDKIDGIVVDVEMPLSDPWLRAVGQWSAGRRRVYAASDLFEAISGRVSLMRISAGIVAGFTGNPGYQLIKRTLDIVGILVSLPITLLLMAATAIAVKIESPGGVIFNQQRIGLGGKPFTMHKFRSMVADSERDGPQFAANGDKRVTRLGAFLRKYRIDELPQIWNILKGDMSLIGPRPEQPVFVEQFNEEIPYYPYRHQVRPGITGWAQTNQGYTADLEATRDKLEYDLYYVKHLSFWLDILIVFKTIRTIFTGFGAR